ncbi:MAG TPA: alkaline phosphatase family protein [Steroidobacteraceae bacterium]|nr:alkaline phosphatase family protein [Steroidobacteraceae bacterium]
MSARIPRLLLPIILAFIAAGATAATPAVPPIRHVFVLILENQSYGASFGRSSQAPYLAQTLPSQGVLLTHYYAIGHASLDNYVALISGQAPNEQTQLDCPVFSEFQLSTPGLNRDGQALGSGCVYPRQVRTLPDQLEAAGLSWKGYMEDMGNDPQREPESCGHVPLGANDPTGIPTVKDQYAAKHDPFVYFHSIIDDRTRCESHVVNLARLRADLASVASTPNYVFITPNLCNDGHDPKCADGREGGFTAINAFLRQWVPLITGSEAFRADGLLIVTFDESDSEGADGSTACCGEQPLPGARYAPGFNGPGGGRIGAVVLSPFVKGGRMSEVPYNHYSLLRTVEAIFSLPPLGYAAQPGARVFGADVFGAAGAQSSAR